MGFSFVKLVFVEGNYTFEDGMYVFNENISSFVYRFLEESHILSMASWHP